MAFKGDASHIPVSNIVQALFMNGQEGVLTIDDGSQHRNIRVLKLGIRPLASSSTNPDTLKYAVVKERILTDAEFQNAISTWDPKTLYPGEFLLRRRLITPEQVEKEIRKQLEELIFDMFSTKDLRYEFRAGEAWLDHELFDPEGLGASLIFNVNGVLMESVRREDDWARIHEEIPSEHEVFVPASESLPSKKPEELDIPSKTYKHIRQRLTGDKTISRIVFESPLSPYEVSHALYKLKTNGFIRSLSLQEKKELAERLRRMLKTKEAVGLYQSILASDPGNLHVRVRLVEILERVKQKPELVVEHYQALIRHFERESPDKALAYADKILQIDPNCLPAYESQFVLNLLKKNKDAAMASVRTLVKTIKGSGWYEEGAEILTRLLSHHPGEPYLLHELADMLLMCGENGKAVSYLKSLAAIYDSRSDRQKLRKTCELIVKIDPSERSRIKKLLAEEKGVRRGSNRVLGMITFAVVGIVLLAGLAYYLALDRMSRARFADIQRAVNTLLQFGKCAEAHKAVADLEDAYPFPLQKRAIADLRAEIQRAEAKREDDERWRTDKIVFRALSTLGKANREVKKGNYKKALELLTDTYDYVSRFKIATEHRGPISKIEEQIGKIRKYFAAAEKLARDALKAEKRGDVGRAHALVREVLRSYPNSPTAKTILVPVLIETDPGGATVTTDNVAVPGRTPLVVKLPPHSMSTLKITRKGFHREILSLETPKKARELVRLRKAAEWAYQHKGPCEGYAAAMGSNVFFANRNGQIYCIDLEGKTKWQFTVPNKSDISSGLRLWNNLVYTGCYDGNLYVLNATTGKLQGQPIRASPMSLAIKTAPSAPGSGGIAVVNCGNRVLSGVNIATKESAWIHSPPNLSLLGPPQVDGDFVYAFTREGALLKFEHTTGKPHPPIPLGGRMNQPGAIADGKAFFSLENRTVAVVDLGTGKVKWKKELESRSTATPTVSTVSHLLVLPLSKTRQLVCLDSRTGAERWRTETRSTIETQGVMFRNKLYMGTRDGCVGRWDLAKGALIWEFQTAGATASPPGVILCPGTISQGRLFQGSTDGYFYCLTLD